ncbi:MAG: SusE domain-containing protein [Bacteroidetes bacterium]|nr:SusE domain-containing protein [Bacteroidota bacterium]
MKKLIKIVFGIAALSFAVVSCDKAKDLAAFSNGNAVVLSGSAATVAPAPADSSKTAITFSWTSPKYAQDSSSYKFIIQIDSTGRNFSKASEITVTGKLNTSLTSKDLNTIALSYGFAFNVAYDMDVRVISSYGNNNERYFSNTIKVKYTPYKVPPKVALPASGKLFLVGSATQGGWNNPVPVPTQEFAQIDETTWAGVFNLVGGNQYLALPVNGDWSHKFAVADGSVPAAGGDFGYDLSTNFNGPATSGWYVITLYFQSGKYTVTPFTGVLPTNLYLVGSATAGGWNNPVPVPSQQFTQVNSSVFKITLPLTGGQEYLMLPVNGDWSHKYAVQDNTLPGLSAGGDFGYDLPKNFPGPAANGTYTITANFATGKFSVQ